MGGDGGVLRVGLLYGGLTLQAVGQLGVVDVVHVLIGRVEKWRRLHGRRRRTRQYAALKLAIFLPIFSTFTVLADPTDPSIAKYNTDHLLLF